LPATPSVDSPAPCLRIGDHLISARRFTSHHGIYAGNGQIIHYAGLASGLQAGPVKVSPLIEFLADHPYKVREYKTRTYSREESVERARARIGEDLYHPVFNNCEHFVTWCITGKPRSTQVDWLFGLTGGAWGLLLSRPGPVLHALYRRIRTDLMNKLRVFRRRPDERRVE
jgi:Lecithin retinol acyltransferase